MTDTGHNPSISSTRIDRITAGVFLALLLLGWLNIYAATWDEAHPGIFDLTQRSGMQLMWMGVSLVVGLVILLLDDKYYHILAYPLYFICLILLAATLGVGREINGARSWIVLGPISLQPAEFMKAATALALARMTSAYRFSIRRPTDLLRAALLLAVPAGIILLQNDTGSALVYGSFLFVFYREGLSGWIYAILAFMIGLFVGSFLLTPVVLLALTLASCAVGEGIQNGRWRTKAILLAGITLGALLLWSIVHLAGGSLSPFGALLIASAGGAVVALLYGWRHRLYNVALYVALFFGSVLYMKEVDYVFGKLQPHQQNRIRELLGITSDLQHAGYNVNQSKIAIGSGGWLGKGYLNGTQTRFNFVPEQSTDFIFCTVGEEWGFVGSVVVLTLFAILILRLMRMGERQKDTFGRVYCYGVAGILFFHVLVNVGMTIGLMPVIGIPLPLFSYGGSSLLAFTALVAIALRLDAGRRNTTPFHNNYP